jgi:hypothetical protein
MNYIMMQNHLVGFVYHNIINHVDVWSVRDFVALPLLQSNITHYIQLGLNTKCSLQQLTNGIGGGGGISSQR